MSKVQTYYFNPETSQLTIVFGGSGAWAYVMTSSVFEKCLESESVEDSLLYEIRHNNLVGVKVNK